MTMFAYKGQREDGSFLLIFKGEQTYHASIIQTKGSDATYGELLVALHVQCFAHVVMMTISLMHGGMPILILYHHS